MLKNGRAVTSHSTPETLPGVDTSRLPVDPKTREPLAPMAQPGYYPGFSTLSQQAFWDEATRNVINNRLHNVPPLRFFSADEAVLMRAICDRLLPQDDRDEEHKIPILNYIDDRLYNKRGDGYRYEDMPPDGEAYHLGLQAIEAIAQHMYDAPFIELGPQEQDNVLFTLHQAQPPAAEDIWKKMSVHRFWLLMMQDVVQAYYAHPYAWDEIGFGGPAYPRGYMRLLEGKPEPWEVEEQRYDWNAPVTSLSGEHQRLGGPGGHKQMTPGQAGTH
ncbi:gluconate 2-dehydrogenase subunit 3 family protein [Ktedonosporobacter rubrisoli]|uniref:Gluconate 2-dehydrogenase subunit 3 family protein n=2 Tax=Ktedonosporobacter rubrisoli TaxID=2509675 RepID=A0A4P6K6A8_KTERU|nr:gluconate 2-dehydrogenase subunit 3 family protein [Ktedonosporobacter rubrisoli]